MECSRAVGIFEQWCPSLGLALTLVISIHVRAEAAHFTGLSASLMAHHDPVSFFLFCPDCLASRAVKLSDSSYRQGVVFTPPRITKRPERIREEGEEERCLNAHIMAGFTFVKTGRKVFKNKMILTTWVTGKGGGKVEP